MSSKCHPTYTLSILAVGAVFFLISSIGAVAADAIDDPVRQPHLKSWSNVIPNASRRFIVLADFNDEAVLDRETGLVWELAPNSPAGSWTAAIAHCFNRTVAGRKGWHLPMVEQLTSLLDFQNSGGGLYLPSGHPFIFPGTGPLYWSATTDADNTVIPHAWHVNFTVGNALTRGKGFGMFAWCVRGGQSFDGNTQ